MLPTMPLDPAQDPSKAQDATKPHCNNGVGNGADKPGVVGDCTPGNAPVNPNELSGPGAKGNAAGGNATGLQSPGSPSLNDASGTGTSNPGNQGGAGPNKGKAAGGNSHALPSLPLDAE
jgi:hypothetical protein